MRALREAHVFGAGALGTLARLEGHFLTLLQLVKANSFHVGHVKEHVLSAAYIDETETPISETLDSTFCHFFSLS